MTSSHVSVLRNLFAWSLFLLARTHSRQQWAMGNMTGSQEGGLTENAGGVMYRYCRCPSVLTSREYNLESTSFVREKVSIFFYNFQSSLLWKCVCVSVFMVEFIYFLCFLGGHRDIPLYKKQTAPTSTPNSWSAPPMSIGAMSTIGRREVFCVLYSKTVLPHRPVCFCWWWTEKCVNSHLTRQ